VLYKPTNGAKKLEYKNKSKSPKSDDEFLLNFAFDKKIIDIEKLENKDTLIALQNATQGTDIKLNRHAKKGDRNLLIVEISVPKASKAAQEESKLQEPNKTNNNDLTDVVKPKEKRPTY
jgi:hypothetical protein